MLHRKQKSSCPKQGTGASYPAVPPKLAQSARFLSYANHVCSPDNGQSPRQKLLREYPGSLLPSQAHSTDGKLPRSHLSRLSESFFVCILLLLNGFFLLVFSIVRFFSFVNEGKEILFFITALAVSPKNLDLSWKAKHIRELDNSICNLRRLLTSFSVLGSRNHNFLLQFLQK